MDFGLVWKRAQARQAQAIIIRFAVAFEAELLVRPRVEAILEVQESVFEEVASIRVVVTVDIEGAGTGAFSLGAVNRDQDFDTMLNACRFPWIDERAIQGPGCLSQ